MRTIGVVVRVSDVKGRDKKGDRFISPGEQVAQTTAYCRAAGFDVLVVEPMDLNVSHTTPLDARPGMGEALRLVDAGALAGIAVASQDRIGPLMLTRELKARLLKAEGVLKVADNPSAEVLDARGYLKLPSEYMSLMHEAQREEIGLRWAAARSNARSRGVLPQRESYGYERAVDGRVVVVPEHAERIREAFRRRAAGESFSAIARSYDWSHSTARQRLSNRTYMGIAGLVPPIVSPAEFEAAQAGRTTQPVAPGETTKHLLLLGLARCAGCGHTLKAPRRPRADGSFVQAYFCKNAASQPCHNRAYVHTDDLDRFVLAWFSDVLKATPRMIDAVAAAHDLEQAEAEHERAEAELRAYLEFASALDRQAFQHGLDVRQARVEQARATVRELSARVTRLPTGGSLAALWHGLTASERREVLHGFIDRVEVARGASRDVAAHVRIFWSDGSLAEATRDEEHIRVTAA